MANKHPFALSLSKGPSILSLSKDLSLSKGPKAIAQASFDRLRTVGNTSSARTGLGGAPAFTFRTHDPPRTTPTQRPRTPAPPGHRGEQTASAGLTTDMATALKE